jgi:sigma-B regulation protein RsbU (phosphoserine phosphatase)
VTSALEPTVDPLALLDEAACGILQTTGDGVILRVNSVFCTWLGYAAEALIGKRRFQDMLTMGGRIFHQTHWAPLLQMQGSISEVKLELVHCDGTIIPMVLNAIRRDRPNGIVVDVATFIARDRDKYEQELVQSRKRLEALVREATRLQDEARDRALFAEQMIGIVSHDLRNPLSGIYIGAALLARGEMAESQRRTLTRITRAVDRANRLIADLLDFTQARLGKGIPISVEAIGLHACVAETVDELAHVYSTRKLAHVCSGEGTCMVDANRLAQVVGNLVSNAVTYGKPETPITVTSVVEPTSCSVSVHNEGSPIPEDVIKTLFLPMTRGTSAASANRSVGLGLFIVSEIARAHGGKAHVTSTLEAGTTFCVEIPRANASDAHVASQR